MRVLHVRTIAAHANAMKAKQNGLKDHAELARNYVDRGAPQLAAQQTHARSTYGVVGRNHGRRTV